MTFRELAAQQDVDISNSTTGYCSTSRLPNDFIMTRPASVNRTVVRRPGASKPPYTSRGGRSYPSRTRNRQRRHRLALGGNTRSQKTLTQLNFVLPKYYPEDDGNSQLIEQEAGQDDDGEDYTELHPGRTKNSGKKRKRQHQSTERPNRTLTQMVNVDWSLGRAEVVEPGQNDTLHARKRRGANMEVIQEEPEGCVGEDYSNKPPSDPIFQEGKANSAVAHAGTETSILNIAAKTKSLAHGQMLPPPNPVTPRKRTRWVVPSSQSPESPEVTLNSPRTPKNVRNSPIRWPLASPTALQDRASLTPSPNKGRRRFLLRFDVNEYDSQIVVEDNFQVDDAAADTAPASPTSVLSSPKPVTDPSVSFKEDIDARLSLARKERSTQSYQTPEPKQQENIVYETDGELDPGSFDDEGPPLPEINYTSNTGNSMTADDQCPVQPVPESNDGQSSQNLPASTYMSDTMSLYYTRRPMSYAYEKFPTSQYLPLDTKDIPESVQDTEPTEPSHSNPLPTVHSDNQTIPTEPLQPLQDDIQSDNSLHQEDPNPDPPQSSPVVQVESSQRSEIEVAGSPAPDAESEPRRIITCSQLLTESLMESIPGPPAWLSTSQNNDHNDLYDNGQDRPRNS
ncbi:uncharacterized protein GIQ15_00872 [Arthroderma uncinatum]|uniref:uncharacterized protein n=1 Tax=Arthroderma uncinatum TaxID=74035 RepID=UPI00144A9C7B|nr:uncharacterized protein GIQ15_00872 [Arthroderma uncinatum]KAF3491355.1 hypothetical protein GIQ15_00872 [Arthroderma uncinatum]